MRKFYFISVLFVLIPLFSICNPVDLSTAKQVASHFWSSVTNSSESTRWTDVTPQTDFQEFYIFTRGTDNGFVIVAADDCVQPILGYSTDSRFISQMPDHVFSFLHRYELEISYYRENNIPATPEIEQQWASLLEGSYTPQLTTAVTPLLSTTWDQDPLYNNLCPDNGNGQHAVTGCVATATAQVMKFWNWPITGVGSHSYYDENFGNQSADFGATTYDWDNMPSALGTSSSSVQITAVATLMYHIGVAVEMMYGLGGSAAALSGPSSYPCSETALKNYFQYKNSLHTVEKDNVSNDQWISTLTSELDAGRPILERGSDPSGGHAFVCDGYNETGLFHINWGWGGYQDGYFAHNALNPGQGGTGGNTSYTFNDDVAVIIGIEPAYIPTYEITTISANNSMGLVTGGGTYDYGQSVTILAEAKPGYRFTHWNDGSTKNPRVFVAHSDTSFTAYFDNLGGEEHHYDNGTVSGFIGANSNLYWGIRFPAGELSNYITFGAVKIMDKEAGTYELKIYQGDLVDNDNIAPDSLLCSQVFTLTGTNDWQYVSLNAPVSLDHSQPLWITFHNQGSAHPAVGSTYAGNPDGSWVSTDGQSWGSVCDYGYYYTWMIRAILSNLEWHAITVISADPTMGTTIGGGSFPYGSEIQIEAVPYAGYEFLHWADDNTAPNPRTVTVTGNTTYTAYFKSVAVGIEDFTMQDIKIYSDAGRIIVDGAEGTCVEIFDMTGKRIATDARNNLSHKTFNINASGIYIVRTGTGMTKKVHVIR